MASLNSTKKWFKTFETQGTHVPLNMIASYCIKIQNTCLLASMFVFCLLPLLFRMSFRLPDSLLMGRASTAIKKAFKLSNFKGTAMYQLGSVRRVLERLLRGLFGWFCKECSPSPGVPCQDPMFIECSPILWITTLKRGLSVDSLTVFDTLLAEESLEPLSQCWSGSPKRWKRAPFDRSSVSLFQRDSSLDQANDVPFVLIAWEKSRIHEFNMLAFEH